MGNLFNFIDNNYSAAATGSSNNDLGKNIGIFLTILKAYATDPNPGSGSVAGATNKSSDYPIYGCQGNNAKLCNAANKVKNRDPQRRPYNDKFFDRNLNGETASSYYIRVGTCNQTDYTNQKECENKEYQWVGDACYSDRYAFINNKPGFNIPFTDKQVAGAKGYFPSLTNDVLSLTPDKVVNAMIGNDVPGFLEIQPCPKQKQKEKHLIKEGFESLYEQNTKLLYILSSLIIVFTIVILIIFRKSNL